MFPAETRILVIDDMPAIRRMVKDSMRQLGYRNFYTAEDGMEGLRVLEQQLLEDEPIQLVLSDWNMPEMPGIELLKQIRELDDYQDVPFLMITAEGQKHQILEAIQAGVTDYILKPFTPDLLEKKLQAAWKKHQKSS